MVTSLTSPSPALAITACATARHLAPAAFIVRARVEGLRDLGSCLSPTNSFIFIQGLETLSLRIQHASQSALEIARWLQSQPEVAWVNYPGLESDQHHEICDRYLKGGFGCIITFGLKDGYEAAKSFVDNTEIFRIVANLGDTKSLIIHPSSTTHRQLSEEQQRSAGVTPDLVRLSIGLEGIEDLKADLAQALKKATSKMLHEVSIPDFRSERGESYPEVVLSYEVAGPPLGSAPLVLVCHALTGNSTVTGDEGWWNSSSARRALSHRRTTRSSPSISQAMPMMGAKPKIPRPLSCVMSLVSSSSLWRHWV